jgi:uncharacterized protein
MDKSAQALEKEIVILQIGIIFVLPILLIYLGVINSDWRIMILLVVCLFIYGITKKESWNREDFGIGKGVFDKYFYQYFIFTSIGVGIILWYANVLGMGVIPRWWENSHFWMIFLLSSFLQEFAYRGFLVPLLKKVFSDKTIVVVVNSILFTAMHTIYPYPNIMLPLAFIAGVGFTIMYLKYPSLVLITLSHAVLNFTAVLLGFFTIINI